MSAKAEYGAETYFMPEAEIVSVDLYRQYDLTHNHTITTKVPWAGWLWGRRYVVSAADRKSVV